MAGREPESERESRARTAAPPVTAESLIAELGYGVPAQAPPPPSRPWLYAGALAFLSVAALWIVRRKR